MLAVTETALPGIGLSIPRVVQRPAEPYVAYRLSGMMRDLPEFAPPHIGRMNAWLAGHGVEPGDSRFFRYLAFGNDGSVEVEVGHTTVRPEPAGDGVVGGELPAGRYAEATYSGPYDRLYDAFCMLNGWIRARHLVPAEQRDDRGVRIGCQLEIYRVTPMDEPDPTKLKTDILIQIA